MRTHIRLWSGSGTARVTDMAEAHRRGKKCRVLRLSGCNWDWERSEMADAGQKAAARHSFLMYARLVELAGAEFNSYPHELPCERGFDEVRAEMHRMLGEARAAGAPAASLDLYDEDVRAIDAPRPRLTAGVERLWGATADESGISLSAHDDPNEWREITHGQTAAAAYAIAARAWPEVRAAKTLHEAASALRRAGAKLHGYCGMD